MFRVGVIGFGARAEAIFKNFVNFQMEVELAAVYDKNRERSLKKIRNSGYDPEKTVFYDDVDDMLDHAKLDGVCVSTNCSTHVYFAEKVLKRNIPMLLEKPVAIHMEELKKLRQLDEKEHAPVLVSFPLRYSNLCQLAKKIIDSGELGEITHIEAVNNVSYGRVYYQSWYHDDSVTGGLFLQKATHDLDYINYLLGREPVLVAAMESKQIFKGDHEAGLTCDKCPEEKTCPESPYVIRNHFLDKDEIYGKRCSFAKDTGNHDSASIMVKYDNGVHAVYTQDFVARRGAARRGAIIIGYKATMEFDWITGELKVHYHRKPHDAVYTIKDNLSFHYGGDKAICENFLGIMEGTQESAAPLSSGILSALMCLKARESAQKECFCRIDQDELCEKE